MPIYPEKMAAKWQMSLTVSTVASQLSGGYNFYNIITASPLSAMYRCAGPLDGLIPPTWRQMRDSSISLQEREVRRREDGFLLPRCTVCTSSLQHSANLVSHSPLSLLAQFTAKSEAISDPLPNKALRHLPYRNADWISEIQYCWGLPTCIVLPVSGVMPSMVRTISNCILLVRSRAEISHSGDSSSILCDTMIGQNIWKKSSVPSISAPKSIPSKW